MTQPAESPGSRRGEVLAALVLSACFLVGACGASFVGPATTDSADPCHGHLQCPKGCCTGANLDGEGWDCVATWEPSAAICKYVGAYDNPGMTGAKRDAGRDR